MVHLVLDHPRLQALGLEGQREALGVQRLDPHPLASLDLAEEAGYREAALLPPHDAPPLDDDGVDQRAWAARAVIDQDDAEADPYLGGSHADAHLVVHGLEHVG